MKQTVSAFKELLSFNIRAGNSLSIHLVQLTDYSEKKPRLGKGR